MKLLILSDMHANRPALEAVLHNEGPWDGVAFCGDVVGVGPQPVECVRWVAEHADFRVRGDLDCALAFGRDLDADYVILGHTCIQDARRVGLFTLVNPGSVGLSHEASGKACYAVFDGARVTLKRVTYELARTIAALRASPLRRSVVRHLEMVLSPDAAGDVDD